MSYAASSSGSFPDGLNSLSGERKRVKGDLRTETFVLHSKLSQAQRLDLDIVHIINQKKSFFCQLHILTEHHLLAASFRIQAMQEGANPIASIVPWLGQKGIKSTQSVIFVFRHLDGDRFSQL